MLLISNYFHLVETTGCYLRCELTLAAQISFQSAEKLASQPWLFLNAQISLDGQIPAKRVVKHAISRTTWHEIYGDAANWNGPF